jgi:hypothetical protein
MDIRSQNAHNDADAILRAQAKRVTKWLFRHDRLRQYVVEHRRDIIVSATNTVLGAIAVRRGYIRTKNSAYVMKNAPTPESLISSPAPTLGILQAMPRETLAIVFKRSTEKKDSGLIEARLDCFT